MVIYRAIPGGADEQVSCTLPRLVPGPAAGSAVAVPALISADAGPGAAA